MFGFFKKKKNNIEGEKKDKPELLENDINSTQENIAQESIAQEDIAQEDIAQENIAQENIAQENIAQKDSIQENISQEEIIQSNDEEVIEKDDTDVVNNTEDDSFYSGLEKSRSKIKTGLSSIFSGQKLTKDMLSKIEDELIISDMGYEAAKKYTNKLSDMKFNSSINYEEVSLIIADLIYEDLKPLEGDIHLKEDSLNSILMVGVNGSGKTTTIGKLSSKFISSGKSVLLAAGDTFRAAAAEQLQIWANRSGAEIYMKNEGFDSAALLYEAYNKSKNEKLDVILMDTAGRLQNKTHLMDELGKVVKVLKKLDENSPNNTYIVLDASVGSNAIDQVKAFNECVNLSGIIMTKLDGSAKGGVLVNIASQFNIPFVAIGMGEGIEDLRGFDARKFANNIMGINLK